MDRSCYEGASLEGCREMKSPLHRTRKKNSEPDLSENDDSEGNCELVVHIVAWKSCDSYMRTGVRYYQPLRLQWRPFLSWLEVWIRPKVCD